VWNPEKEMDIAELDKKLLKLAIEQKWQKCPHCTIFVESSGGCEHIACRLLSCYHSSSFSGFLLSNLCLYIIGKRLCYYPHCYVLRCGCDFCYVCGKKWVFGHTCRNPPSI